MTTREKYETLRDKSGMTDYQVMTKANIPKGTFYTWRAALASKPWATMSLGNMQKVAQALGVRLDEIVGDVS